MNQPEADTESIIRVASCRSTQFYYGITRRIQHTSGEAIMEAKNKESDARTLLQPNFGIGWQQVLDYDTEANVCQNLQFELKNTTVFFITHRLSTVKHADKIILMHQGKIAEQGTHKELIELGGRYAALYSHQGED